ncbi:MAG: divergent PAP2 family protein [Clostridia bacterium]
MNITITNCINLILISSLSTLVFVQVFKTVLNSILIGKFDKKTLFSDGDFPSSHTAILICFNIIFWYIVYLYSLANPTTDIFVCVLIGLVLLLWSCYEIRDAMGVRLRVQEQAYAIKQIATTSKEMSDKLENLNLVDENVNCDAIQEELDDLLVGLKLKAGHLPYEVFGGILTGTLIGLLYVTFFESNLTLFITVSFIFISYILLTMLMFNNKRRKNIKKNK